MSDLLELLQRAFPKNSDGEGYCAWDGKPRNLDHALCGGCWLNRMTDGERRTYRTLSMQARAQWIVDRIPGALQRQNVAFKRCEKCQAPIFFVQTERGKWTPLDVEPTSDGMYILREVNGSAVAMWIGKSPTNDKRFTTHFATCPFAESFRNRRKNDVDQDSRRPVEKGTEDHAAV